MSLACYNEISYAEFGERFRAHVGNERMPLSGSWEVTERCNLTCAHCSTRQPAAGRGIAERELTVAQIEGILRQAVDEGCLYLVCTGGEPFLRPDFPEAYRLAKRLGLLVTIFTNGTLITPGIADLLADWRPNAVEITLYGDSAEVYESVTGVPGSYARCMRGIDLLLGRGVRLNLKATIMRTNQHELDAMRARAERMGLDFRFDAMLFPRFDGRVHNLAVRLSPEEVLALEAADGERARKWTEVGSVVDRRFRALDEVYFCGAGIHSFHLDAYGRLSLCAIARQPGFDLLRGSFKEGWHGLLGAARAAKRTRQTDCSICQAGPFCSQCPGWSQLVHGDTESPVEFVCQVGRLRAQSFS